MTQQVIFASGSIAGKGRLPEPALQALDQAMHAGHIVVVGDAPGVDAEVQRHLSSRGYLDVEVFHIGASPRTLVDSRWTVRCVDVDTSDKKLYKDGKYTRQAQMLKDAAMAKRATGGLAVWRDISVNRFGKTVVSKGTLQNMVNLLSENKRVLLHLLQYPEYGLIPLGSLNDLEEAIRGVVSEEARRCFQEMASRATVLPLFPKSYGSSA